jgi:transposase
MTAQKFEDWFCGFLLPLTNRGDCIILDNASWHNKKRLRMYALVYKVAIIFLPPYSPDYSPIENVWANLKQFIRNYGHHFQIVQRAIYWYFSFAYS